MSTYGSYSLRLKRQRQEQLRRRREKQRKEKVRKEAANLIADSRQMSKRSSNRIIEHFTQDARQQTEKLAQQAEQLLQSNPDEALKLARNCRAATERGMAEASHKVAEWGREKTAAELAVTVLRLALDSALNSLATDNDSRSQLTSVAHQLAAAKAALRREELEAAKKLADTGQKQIHQIEQAHYHKQQQEEVRRETVRGLRDVLTGMNFVVDRPQMGDGREEGKVVLVGTLPSGRTARFAVALDGQVEYDFDGYPHRECRKDSDEIRRQLEWQCQGETSDIESYWKDNRPDLTSGVGRRSTAKRHKSA